MGKLPAPTFARPQLTSSGRYLANSWQQNLDPKKKLKRTSLLHLLLQAIRVSVAKFMHFAQSKAVQTLTEDS